MLLSILLCKWQFHLLKKNVSKKIWNLSIFRVTTTAIDVGLWDYFSWSIDAIFSHYCFCQVHHPRWMPAKWKDQNNVANMIKSHFPHELNGSRYLLNEAYIQFYIQYQGEENIETFLEDQDVKDFYNNFYPSCNHRVTFNVKIECNYRFSNYPYTGCRPSITHHSAQLVSIKMHANEGIHI